jgi:hypothetical protein
MNKKELEQKIISFGVDYERKNQRLIYKSKHDSKDGLTYAYNSGFISALSFVLEDLRKLD